MIKLSKIKANPNNPRVIKDEKFEGLCKSIKEFPKMMELRPIIVNDEFMVLGGNMRRKALEELGYKEIDNSWVKKASELTREEQERFIVADNVGYGDWEFDMLLEQHSEDVLKDWGVIL